MYKVTCPAPMPVPGQEGLTWQLVDFVESQCMTLPAARVKGALEISARIRAKFAGSTEGDAVDLLDEEYEHLVKLAQLENERVGTAFIPMVFHFLGALYAAVHSTPEKPKPKQ